MFGRLGKDQIAVRMEVDEAWRDDKPSGIELLSSFDVLELSDRDNFP